VLVGRYPAAKSRPPAPSPPCRRRSCRSAVAIAGAPSDILRAAYLQRRLSPCAGGAGGAAASFALNAPRLLTNEIYQDLKFVPGFGRLGRLLAPLYTGGYLQAQVKIANQNQKAALALYGQTLLQAFDDVE